MSTRTLQVTDALYDYLIQTVREPDVLRRLREETAALPMSMMQISPEQGQFMRLLVELIGAERTIEVGVFTGYSAISVALGLPAQGRIVACDVNEEYTSVARRYFEQANVASKIDLRIAPAAGTLQSLIDEGASASFDFAFIDADKTNYDLYYEHCLRLLRRGGLLALDNMLWNGSVADPTKQDENTTAIRALNAKVVRDERVSMSLVPIGDGVLLARKL
jgi:caffeoyl-CoA O-methyltransferase